MDECCGRPRKHRFVTTTARAEAQERFLARLAPGPLGVEQIPSAQALGRVTAAAVLAQTSTPHYHGAAMDGIAVRSAACASASEASPLVLRAPDGYRPLDTGDPLPDGFDAVVMIEEVRELGEGEVEIARAVPPRQHVRAVGEDIVRGEVVLPRGQRLRPADLAALLATGNLSVAVARRPLVGILPTGDEVVEPGSPLEPGAIVESNGTMVAAVAAEEGAEARRYPICRDDEAALRRALETILAECDLAVVIAGSSAGRGDFTPRVLERLGELLVRGVAIMPGKPVALAIAASGKPILGLPGYPVSAALCCDLFLRPVLARLLGSAASGREELEAVVRRRVPSRLGAEEYVRAMVGRVRGERVAVPLGRGAGAITSLAKAQALIRIPESREGLEAGSRVAVELLVPRAQVERTTLCVGSHDPALDVLAELWAEANPGARLASASVGSLGGLLALGAGEAHLAGSHLLDPATGEYNLPDLDRHLRGSPVAVVTLAHRAQGLLVPRGNPKRLAGLEDLARGEVRFVNRQRGSGTRVLLDHELARRGIDPRSIRGYSVEEFTHASVAVAVRSGAADAGLGVLAAARALELDFVPLAEERYDLVVPLELLGDERVAPVLELLATRRFRERLRALGGYDDRETGRRVR